MQQPAEEQYEEYDSQEGSQYAEEELDVEADLLDAGEEGVEEYESDDGEADGEIAAEGDEADDEDDEAGGAGGSGGGAGGQGQMLYIPGLGYIPLANFPGLGGAAAGGRGGPAGPPPQPEGEREWEGLGEMPAATQEGLFNALSALKEEGRTELTVLVLGKGGVGKSSTINSLLNERAATVTAFQQDVTKPTAFSRTAADFTLHLIDTPSALDQDNVSDAKLEAIGRAVRDRGVDAVLYLDRLDSYRLDTLDRKVLEGISRVLGPRVWDNCVLAFARASESSAPGGLDFHDHVAARADALRAAIRKAGGAPDAELPMALVENSSRCPTNADGEKVVPGEVPWVVDLVEKVVEVALNVPPFEYDPRAAAKASNPNRRRKWLIPLVLAAQVALKLLMDRVMDEDGCRGDDKGPFDARTQRERHEDLKREKEEQRKKNERKKRSASAASSSYYGAPGSDSEDEDDY